MPADLAALLSFNQLDDRSPTNTVFGGRSPTAQVGTPIANVASERSPTAVVALTTSSDNVDESSKEFAYAVSLLQKGFELNNICSIIDCNRDMDAFIVDDVFLLACVEDAAKREAAHFIQIA